MGLVINEHCKDCQARTKLLLKQGKELRLWCSVAKECPYSKPMEPKQ